MKRKDWIYFSCFSVTAAIQIAEFLKNAHIGLFVFSCLFAIATLVDAVISNKS